MPPENFLEPNCLQCRKMPLQQVGEMERVKYEGKFLPVLPPMNEGRGGSCPSWPPSAGVPGQGLKGRARGEQYYPLLFCLSLASTYNRIFLGRKWKKDELAQWVHSVKKNNYSNFQSQNVIFEMWLKDYLDGQPKESYLLKNN